jgi:hypothetical protein
MLDRLNPSSVLTGVLAGLRRRSRTGEEKPDIAARVVLFGLPFGVAVALILSRTIIANAEVVLAAAALLVGALLAGFSQVAGWREKVLERRRSVDKVRVRALNEAGALILMSIHVSVLASVAVFVVAMVELEHAEEWIRCVTVVLSSVGPAALAYVALSLVFVANLLWDGFVNDQSDVERDGLADFDSGGEG